MSIRRSAALTLVPVLVLAGIAGFGLVSYRYAVVAEARDSAAVWVRRADDFQARFAARAAELPPVVGYAAIPAGGDPPSGDARRLEAAGSDPAALRALVGSRESSASGLPVAVLAAWRLYAATGDPADAEALARLAIHELPSPISEPALRSLAEKMPAPGEAWLAEWRLAEARRAVIAALPGGGRGFVRTGAGAGFGSGDRALAPAEVRALAAEIRGEEVRAGLPPWMALGFEAAGESLTAPVADPLAGAEAEAAPDGGSGLRVVAGIADESVLFARYRRVVWWAVALIGCSLAASAAGIAAMARAVANERRLGAQKSQFVASVSHELRTPVASMRLMAEALDAGRVGGAEAREFHRLMAQEGARLSALIENVLEFARIEGGTETLSLCRDRSRRATAADTAA
ncbi:MAG: histidine kinase dimerization/phospho-acceptor domain-containing protein [Verrucomicrobiales bacterium]